MDRRPRGPHMTSLAAVVSALAALASGCGDRSSTSLEALSPATGEDQWRRGDVLVGGAMETGADTIAVVGYERCSNRGRLTVLDAVSGATRWSTPMEGGFGERSVAIASDLVVSSGTSGVRALAIVDGAERWTRSAAWPDPLVAAQDDRILVAELTRPADRRTFTSRLGFVDPGDGTTRWEVEFAEEQVIDLVVDGAVVYVRLSGMSEERAGHTTVVAVDAAEGLVRWTRDLGVSEVGTGLLVADDTVVVNLQTISWLDGERELGPSSAVVALDRADGTDRWRLDGPAGDTDPPPGSPVMAFDADGSTLIGRDVDGLVAWDSATGTVRWRRSVSPGDAWMVDDQILWAPQVGPAGGGDRLDAVDTDTGESRWSTATDGWVRDVEAVGGFLVASGDSPSCD